MLGNPEAQFSLTRAALRTSRRTKSNFLSVSVGNTHRPRRILNTASLQTWRHPGLLLCIAMLLSHVPGTAWGGPVVLFDQPGTATATFIAGDSGTNFDNFTLASAAQVTTVAWRGFYAWDKGPMTSVKVSLYSDNAGQPGDQLCSATFAGAANESLFTGPSWRPNYTYLVDLPSPFIAEAGLQYWICIRPAVLSPYTWCWMMGTGDTVSYREHDPGYSRLWGDFAVTLYNVPEPGTLSLLALGLLAFVRHHRLKSTGRSA